MLYAMLVCTDPRCGAEFEGWGEAEDFDDVRCEDCGGRLHALAFSEARGGTFTELPRRTPFLQQRHAA